MKKIEAKIIADSISSQGHRIVTMLLTYPRFIHGEVMTHRMFSRNSASSRAIPFEKMVKMVEEDPFIPIAWQKDHKGMQGSEYITDQKIIDFKSGVWLQARNEAIKRAKELNNNLTKYKSIDDYEELEGTGVTKQLCNRFLEPFMWHTSLVTATDFSNFFNLRCPKLYHAATGLTYNSLKDWNNVDKEIQYNGLTCLHPENSSQAEIHIQALAEAMWDVMNESKPNKLEAGEWHIPFGDKITDEGIWPFIEHEDDIELAQIKIATARAARLSYSTFDGEIDYKKDIALHDQLLKDKHFSPFEHVARCMTTQEYYGHHLSQGNGDPFDNNGKDMYGVCNNFRGWIQYRYLIENETT